MAELRIQPKKSAPSPWLLVGLAVLLVAAAAYFFLRSDPTDTPAPVATALPAPADTLAPDSPAAQARATPPPADSVPDNAPAATSAYTSSGLAALSVDLLQLTDRADLRDDATIREQRDNFTSATARLADADPQASLRPGLVATAALLLAVQQKAYPDLAPQAADLVRRAGELSGRQATPAEQDQNRAYVDQASALLKAMSEPTGQTI